MARLINKQPIHIAFFLLWNKLAHSIYLQQKFNIQQTLIIPHVVSTLEQGNTNNINIWW